MIAERNLNLPKGNKSFINKGTLQHPKGVKKIGRRRKLTEGTIKTATSLSNRIAKVTKLHALERANTIMKEYVLSSTGFANKKKAEEKVNNWWKNGRLEGTDTKLYKVVEVYDLELKFVKRKS